MQTDIVSYYELYNFTKQYVSSYRSAARAGCKDQARDFLKFIRCSRIIQILKPIDFSQIGLVTIDVSHLEWQLNQLEQECHPSAWIRLLLHREWNKRKGLGIPKNNYQTANRIGGRSPAPISRFARIVIHSRLGDTVIRLYPLTRNEKLMDAYLNKLSPSVTRAPGGVSQRTKIPRVTRRVGVKTLRAK